MEKFSRLVTTLCFALVLPACSDGNGTAVSTDDPGTGTPVITPTPADPAAPPQSDAPPASDPPASDPPASDPPASDPPASDPPASDPPASDPPASDPPASDPPVSDPPVSDPPVSDPPVSDPTDNPLPTDIPADAFNSHLEAAPTEAPSDGFPSVPQNLRVDLLSNNWVELNWAPSVDDGRVVEYRLRRSDSVEFSIRPDQTHGESGSQAEINKYWETTSFIDCNFTRFLNFVHKCAENQPETGAEYFYTISAIDNDGNESTPSEPLRVQLYDTAGSPVEPFEDDYLDKDDTFPFATDLSSTANFLDSFQMVFNDEFDGDNLDESKWNTVLTWGHNEAINGEMQYFVDILDNPEFGYNPFVFNGETLSIEAIQTPPELSEAALGQPFLSGALSTHDKFGFTYGYVEGRMKVGGIAGQLSSFYLFRRWAAQHSPEIDIVEFLGENPFGDEDAFQTYHFSDPVHATTRSSPTMKVVAQSGRFSDDFHVFGVLWEPDLVIWYIDGQEVIRLSGDQVSRQQMNIVTYLVTGSAWAPRPADDDEIYPLRFEIDYIRAYQREPYATHQQ